MLVSVSCGVTRFVVGESSLNSLIFVDYVQSDNFFFQSDNFKPGKPQMFRL